MPSHRRNPSFFFAGFLALGLLAVEVHVASPRSQAQQTAQPATAAPRLNHPDALCRGCHREIYDRYEQTSMARGSGLAKDGLDKAERSAVDLVHKPSGVTYHVTVRDDRAYLHYSRPASPEHPALAGEYLLDFFIGSGHRGRTYLYNLDGLWFEIPINWYGKTEMWDMAPAYDNAPVMPGPLPVDPNCLHCHAGDVQPSAGPARNRFSTQPFLSAGIGCAACHGDPTEHLRQTSLARDHSGGESATQQPLERRLIDMPNIVNPAKLDPVRRDSVCLQCHLEGDASVYLPGRSLQAFKPGEDLAKSVNYFIDSTRTQLGLRATSQYEALLRSACKRAIGDRLTCTTCHDPHSSPAPAARIAYFRARCLTCHTGDAMMTRHHPEQQDCAVCHMPTRKTSDISHEQLTDHDIEAIPVLPRTTPPGESPGPSKLIPVGGRPASVRELGLAYAQLAERGDRGAAKSALALLKRAEEDGSADADVMDQLGFLLQITGSTSAAAEHYRSALARMPGDPTAQSNLAVIDAFSGKMDEAISLLSAVVRTDPAKSSASLNLAFILCRSGHKADAMRTIDLVLRYNPDSIEAHRFRATGTYGSDHCSLQ